MWPYTLVSDAVEGTTFAEDTEADYPVVLEKLESERLTLRHFHFFRGKLRFVDVDIEFATITRKTFYTVIALPPVFVSARQKLVCSIADLPS